VDILISLHLLMIILDIYTYVYLIKHKSESFERFKEFINKIEKQTENSIKIIWSDRDGEY
jgi:uncharacterized membrane protein